jgi:hypothetical protein
MTQNMVLGITHRVVKYSVVQKITELVANHYLNPSINQNSFLIGHKILNKNKHECLPVSDERCVHSRELFPATIPSQEVCDSTERFLIPQELIRLRGLKKMIK